MPVTSPLRLSLLLPLLGSLLMTSIASCRKPPAFKGVNGPDTPATGDPSTTGPGAKDGKPGTTLPGPIPPLTLSLKRLEPVVFKGLLNKLAFIADADSNQLEGNSAFKLLLANRYNLGDYDFARRSPGHSQWEVTQMHLWMESLVPYCTSQSLKTKYGSDVGRFVAAALGREAKPDETQLLNSKTKLASNKDTKFEGACIAYLSSLEFRNQWSAAKPTVKDYLNTVAASLALRPLLTAESKADKSVESIIQNWIESPRFILSSRMYVEKLLRSSGSADGIDFDLPGNLMTKIVTKKEPFSGILTSNTCYDKDSKAIACDTKAPYNAGVLTMRSFMQSHAGPFNISRAYFLLRTFTCLTYPINSKLEPPLKQADLIPTFAQTDGQGFGGDNGNGTNCYSCHSQFGKHAQLFVKFDNKGFYVAEADGQQDPNPAVGSGYTSRLTYVSHMADQDSAASEESEYFGKPVSNLNDAAKALVADDTFLQCSIRKVLGHYLRMQDSDVTGIPSDLINSIKAEIKKENKDPSFQTIVLKSLSNPHVIKSFLENQEN